jgi:hypothetical protein
MNTKQSFLLIFLSAFLGWNVSAQNNSSKQAEELLDKEKLDSAVIKYEQLVQSQPQNDAYKQELLNIYFFTNRPVKAVNLCESLLKSPKYAQDLNFHFGYADLLMMAGNYAKAKTHLLGIKDAPWVMQQPAMRAGIEGRIEKIDFAQSIKDKTPAFVVKNQATVNSKYPDFAPQIIGNKVYFESKRPVANPSGLGGYSDVNTGFLYHATRVGGLDLTGTATVFPIQSPEFTYNANLAPFCYSDKSDMVFLSQNSFPAGLRHPRRIGKASGTNLGFFNNKKLENLPPPGPGSLPNEFPHAANSSGFPCLADNGNTLYFASTSNFNGEGYGGYDLWVSYFKNGTWTEPRNLGPKVNSPGDDICPFVDANGILYFSSNTHFGFGGFDVYRAQKTQDGWGALRHMGPGVNSPQDDLYFVFDDVNKVGYFTSNRKGGAGDYDIYSANFTGVLDMLPALFDENEVIVIEEPEPQPEPQPNPDPQPQADPNANSNTVVKKDDNNGGKALFDPQQIEKDKEKYSANNTNNDPYSKKIPCADNAYIGVVLDAVSKRPVEGVWVYVQNMKNGVKFKKLTSKYGEYAVILEPQTQYEILCSREGYENLREEVFTGDGQKHTLLGQLSLNPSGTNINDYDLASRGGAAPSNEKAVNEKFVRASVANKAIPAEGYLIQIGVFKDLPKNLRAELEEHANLLTEQHSSMNASIYRLGIFADKAHATEVLAKVKAMKDFKGAFMKTEALSSRNSAERMNNQATVIFPLSAKDEMVKEEPSPTPGNNNLFGDPEKNVEDPNTNEWAEMPRGGNKDEVVVVENPRENYADNPNLDGTTGRGAARPLEYKVQIGAYSKPESANFPDLSHVGKLEKRINRSNGLTYFFVTGYTDLDDARKARVKVEAAGVKNAFIVAFKNGNRVPLKDAVN